MNEMPEIGEIKRCYEIGHNWGSSNKHIWLACPSCGKERWVVLRRGKPISSLCRACSNKIVNLKQRKKWQGNKRRSNGYILVKLEPDDFFYPMTNYKGYVMEHRLIVAKREKRCLLPWEVVHHKDGIRDHNIQENLVLLPDKRWHLIETVTKSYIAKLEKRVTLLETENVALRKQVESGDQ